MSVLVVGMRLRYFEELVYVLPGCSFVLHEKWATADNPDEPYQFWGTRPLTSIEQSNNKENARGLFGPAHYMMGLYAEPIVQGQT